LHKFILYFIYKINYLQQKKNLKEKFHYYISDMSTQQELTQQQALELLVSGVQAAQRKGAYNLEEAELLARACRVFVRPSTEQAAPQPPTSTQGQTTAPQKSLQPVNDPYNVQTI
jgi:hypothetical protein